MILRTGRRALALFTLIAALGALAFAAPVWAQGHGHGGGGGAGGGGGGGGDESAGDASSGQTKVITQEDCDAGNITRNGRQLSQSECEALIGQRVSLADTGFEAWILGLGGLALMAAGGGVVLRRRGPARQIA